MQKDFRKQVQPSQFQETLLGTWFFLILNKEQKCSRINIKSFQWPVQRQRNSKRMSQIWRITSKSFGKSFLEFTFSQEGIVGALKELNPSSACPDKDITAKILTCCRDELATPRFILWSYSFQTGAISRDFKAQFITPVYIRRVATLTLRTTDQFR